jgi:hypothetical protein
MLSLLYSLFIQHLDWLLPEGASIGCDFAGTVAAVGEKAKDAGFKIGDDVAGFVRGGSIDKDNGAFQGESVPDCNVFSLRLVVAHRVRQYASTIDLA